MVFFLGAYGSLPDAAIWWCLRTGGGGVLTRFTSFDKVNYVKIYIHDGCPEEPVKKGRSKSHTSGRTTVKTTRKPSKNAFFPFKTRKKHKKMHIERQKMTFFEICLDEISYDTPYLQVCIEKKSV